MLKKTFVWKHNIDLSKYSQLQCWLKTKNDGYESKKSNVFTPEEISKFVVEAPNVSYLAMKAVLGFGIIGVLRGDELTNLIVDNVKDNGNEIIVKIPTTKNKVPKMYVIDGEFTNIIRQYIKLRPLNVTTNRLFLQYRNGKCINQVLGKNSIAKIPKEMAKFLKLPDPGSYTGHSYRRTGTTIAANAGASIEQLKRIGNWKSTSVCEKYIQESLGHKRILGKMISGPINLPTVTIDNINESSGAVSSSATSVARYLSHTTNTDAISTPMSNSDACSSSATSSAGCLSQTMNSVGINVPDKKNNIIFHFGGECSKFTIINMK